MSGARVFIRSSPGPVSDIALLTDADGRFALSLALFGRYELACHSDAHGVTSVGVEVSAENMAEFILQFAKRPGAV